MKNMRKLIPAIAMLLVSAVMMSTASFAWFSVANVATATGMQVKATSSGGIAIAGFTHDGTNFEAPDIEKFKSTVDLSTVWNNAPTTVKPVSLASGNAKWYTGSSDKVDSSAINTTGYTEVTLGATDDNKDYMYHTKVQIKSLASTGSTHLYVQQAKITLSGAGSASTTGALNASLRIAFKVYDGTSTKWFFLAPGIADGSAHVANHVKDGTITTKVVDSVTVVDDAGIATYTHVDATNTAAANENDIAYGQASNMCIYDALTTAAVTVDIYVYYEGADPACMTSYAINLQDTKIDLTFYAA
jgi:hypothetical protein